MTDDRGRKKYFVDTRMRATDPHKWHCYEALHDVWVAAFRDRAEADRYCEERNREEEAKAAPVMTLRIAGLSGEAQVFASDSAEDVASKVRTLSSRRGVAVTKEQKLEIVEFMRELGRVWDYALPWLKELGLEPTEAEADAIERMNGATSD